MLIQIIYGIDMFRYMDMDMDNLNDGIPKDHIAEFILSPIREDMSSIPGMNINNVEIFKRYGITNTYQLIGIFLSFKIDKQTTVQLYEKTKEFLEEKGITDINLIISSIFEKIDTIMPGFCDMYEIKI